ncbi:DUF2993 domain-containing protein [Streptomyces sp. B3I8]|uniref:LmeA family phospholipid-binding protein n=1 Tax=Streptomyces sp. B3I8 TaxID=3042303 RepID=UPI0027824C78|nr:DUF2993 domain-containing protein [Streptomyces sp. B3I8]MDQ0787810.1 hypothetical protein [Streptomyces sp. B3I8]
MRALRILLIVVVILGGLFTIADRVAVHFAQSEAADRIKTNEHLAETPSVSIDGFPFLTQVAGGELDEIHVGIKDYEVATGTAGKSGAAGAGTIRIDDLHADMHGVDFSSDYSSATARTATGTATISYDELLKAAKPEPTQVFPGVTAKVLGLSDGGNGKIKVKVRLEGSVGPKKFSQTTSILSSVTVEGDTVKVHADSLPETGLGLVERDVRSVTDFQQVIDKLPGGIKIDKVEAAQEGVHITAKGTDVDVTG